MPAIPSLVQFTPNTLAKSSEMNSNNASIRDTVNSYCVFKDIAAQISVTHTFNLAQIFLQGVQISGGNTNISEIQSLKFNAAVSKIVPGATSLSLRNAADTFDNVLVNDAGIVTLRDQLQWTGAGAPRLGTTDANGLIFKTNATDRWQIASTGAFLAMTDTTLDIGASASGRPRDCFIGRDLTVAGAVNAVNASLTAKAQTANITAVGTGASTAEVDLISTTLPTISDGETVCVLASGTVTGTAAAKTIKLVVGGSVLGNLITVAAGTTGLWYFSGSITKDGANVHAEFRRSADLLNADVLNLWVANAVPLSGAIVKCTGQTTNAADEVTQEKLVVYIVRP